jgi:hypothetical protein
MQNTKSVCLPMRDYYLLCFVHTFTPFNIAGQIIVIRDRSFEYQDCDLWNMKPCSFVDRHQRLKEHLAYIITYTDEESTILFLKVDVQISDYTASNPGRVQSRFKRTILWLRYRS